MSNSLERDLFCWLWNNEDDAQIGHEADAGEGGETANLGNMQTVNNKEESAAGQAHCQRPEPQGSEHQWKVFMDSVTRSKIKDVELMQVEMKALYLLLN